MVLEWKNWVRSFCICVSWSHDVLCSGKNGLSMPLKYKSLLRRCAAGLINQGLLASSDATIIYLSTDDHLCPYCVARPIEKPSARRCSKLNINLIGAQNRVGRLLVNLDHFPIITVLHYEGGDGCHQGECVMILPFALGF